MTHGFLLVMGGFTLNRGDENLGILSYERFIKLEQEGDIELPTITREEIEDKSKGDGLSKAIAVLQAIWFIVQCIARRVQGLDITELELTTIALCSISTVTYLFWWYKPLNIKCPVRVYLKPDSDYVYVSKLTRSTTITDPDIISLVIDGGEEAASESQDVVSGLFQLVAIDNFV